MKLEKIAAVAEIISSIAIVITLVYLSIQTRQTNETLLANSRQMSMMADVELITNSIDNPQAVANATQPLSELSPAESNQVGNIIAGLIRTREFSFHQYQSGILDKATLDSYMGTLVRWINSGETDLFYWQKFSKEVDPEFVGYVNALLKKTP